VSEDRSATSQHASASTRFVWLEWITACVLLAVILTLAWIVLVAYLPQWFSWGSTEVQVVVVSVLFLAALLLVSTIALLHTRG
jgi:hypothetical protein